MNPCGFSKYEIDTLKKYSEGRVVDPEDENIIEEFAMVGFVRPGFSLSKKMKTAITTDMGRLVYCG